MVVWAAAMVNMFLSVEFGGEMEWLLRCRAWCTGYIHGCPENCLQLCISMWWGISLLYADSYRQIMPSSNSDRMQLRFFFHMFISLPFMSLIYIYIYLLQCGFQWEAWSWMEPHISSPYPTVETLASKVTMQPWKFASILVAGGTHK